MSFTACLVVSMVIWLLTPMGALPIPDLELVEASGNRTRRDITCKLDHEYLSNGICCLNCPAGTHFISACTRPGEKGKCEECQDGTYTEHGNNLKKCLPCTTCRTDEEPVRQCTGTQNAQCQCKQGGFCAPEQACEVCRECLSCKTDEVKVRNCTATSNTECKKIQPPSEPETGNVVTVSVVAVVLFVVGLGIVIAVLVKRNRDRQRDSQRPPSELLEDEQKEALSSEEKRSRENGRSSHSRLMQYPQAETELFPRLTPTNGEASLSSCFEYFEDLDVDYTTRFFRGLGVHDNTIKSHHGLQHEDRIHALLIVWMEKEGKGADLNDLLKTLLDLNQKLTAEKVKDKAVDNGHYVHVSDREESEQ